MLGRTNARLIRGTYNFAYTGGVQTFTAPYSGDYVFETWGGHGYTSNIALGRSGYCKGTLHLEAGTTLYIHVGQGGVRGRRTYGGGGAQTGGDYCAGGGATDVRVNSGAWGDAQGLRSRIMVAAGGGGVTSTPTNTGATSSGGGLSGDSSVRINGSCPLAGGGTQTSGGTGTQGYDPGGGSARGGNGSWANGGNGGSSYNSGGGGGGWYGGGGGGHTPYSTTGGGGGSSFISGYTGCNAVNANGAHTGQPNSYTGYVFQNPVMYAGNSGSRPGNPGGVNGYCRITFDGVIV